MHVYGSSSPGWDLGWAMQEFGPSIFNDIQIRSQGVAFQVRSMSRPDGTRFVVRPEVGNPKADPDACGCILALEHGDTTSKADLRLELDGYFR